VARAEAALVDRALGDPVHEDQQTRRRIPIPGQRGQNMIGASPLTPSPTVSGTPSMPGRARQEQTTIRRSVATGPAAAAGSPRVAAAGNRRRQAREPYAKAVKLAHR
jgi:hypothetical protein